MYNFYILSKELNNKKYMNCTKLFCFTKLTSVGATPLVTLTRMFHCAPFEFDPIRWSWRNGNRRN